MSAAAKNSAAYWRIAGMSYLKYANACGEVVRQSLKEPFLTQVRTIDRRARETSTNDARDADSGATRDATTARAMGFRPIAGGGVARLFRRARAGD